MVLFTLGWPAGTALLFDIHVPFFVLTLRFDTLSRYELNNFNQSLHFIEWLGVILSCGPDRESALLA